MKTTFVRTTTTILLCIPLTFASATTPLNDTGITYMGVYPKGINASCDLATLQDCATGRSALIHKQTESVFQFKKLDKAGKTLPDSNENHACVEDKITGLFWEVKSAQTGSENLHNKADKFTWYHSNHNKNGGNIGDWNKNNASCTGYTAGKPRTYCHIEQFASRVNQSRLCGFDDWRVPTRQELSSIVHFGQFQPSIDRRFFPHTLNDFYWTQDPVAGRPIEGWTVDFDFGTTSPLRKTDLRPVRLVRGQMQHDALAKGTQYQPVAASSDMQLCQVDNIQASTPSLRFTPYEKNSVLDRFTGLVWHRCLHGQSGQACDLGSPLALNWQDALNAIDGENGWRIPNIRELASLTELACNRPAIRLDLFPTPNRAQLWSSSPYRFYDHYSWYWDAEDGIFIYGERTDKRLLRLVKNAAE